MPALEMEQDRIYKCFKMRIYSGSNLIKIIQLLPIYLYIRTMSKKLIKEYNNFYIPSDQNNANLQADIDQILDQYLMPYQQLIKKQTFINKLPFMDTLSTLTSTINPVTQQQQPAVQKDNNKEIIQKHEYQIISNFQENQRKQSVIRKNTETLNLNSYFHKQIQNHLNKLMHFHIFSHEQICIIQQFKKSSKNFQSFQILFNCPKLKTQCLKCLKSIDFIRNLFSSPKMHFDRKISILAYIGRFCYSFSHNQHRNSWKC